MVNLPSSVLGEANYDSSDIDNADIVTDSEEQILMEWWTELTSGGGLWIHQHRDSRVMI